MVMYANEFETKEKQKLTEIKNELLHINIVYKLQMKRIAVNGVVTRSVSSKLIRLSDDCLVRETPNYNPISFYPFHLYFTWHIFMH